MASTIRNLKIRHQMLLFMLPPLLALLCAIGLAFFAYRTVASSNQAAARSKERVAKNLAFWSHASQLFFAVQKYAGAHDGAVLISYDRVAADGLADLNTLADLEASDVDHARQVAVMREEYVTFRDGWAQSTLARARTDPNYDSTAAMAEGRQRLNSIGTDSARLRKENEDADGREMQSAEQVMRHLLVAGVSLTLLVAVALFSLKAVWTRQMIVPLRQLTQASEEVGRGELAPVLPSPGDNELGALFRSFLRMTGALKREREELAALNQFSQAVTQCASEQEVYDLVLHSLKERFQPRQIIIFKLQTPESFLEAVATLAPLSREVRGRPVIEEPHDCKAVREGRSFLVNDVRSQASCPSRFSLPSDGNYFCGPLIAGGVIIGSLRMEATADVLTADRRRLVENYLSGAASALSNLRHLGRMKEQANFDEVTGLYNRRFMQDYGRKQIAIARREQQPVGVLMLDLDHFKRINDEYGHAMGDSVLRHFARTISATVREANLFARYGGEEFILLVYRANSEACILVAERIRNAVMAMAVPSNTENPLPQITVSIGVAVFAEHGETLEKVIEEADKALYESKRAGRNRVTLAVAREARSTHA
ncbi:MAG TPA: diguanylate cyclase [Terriglobales bacterium]|nr:diguanylate cyclase [Terriglobales bacterium]